jgi:hypothetical protein
MGRGDIRDRHARASKGRARPTQNAYLHARGERRPVSGHHMAFLARRFRGKQDPPATEATPSQHLSHLGHQRLHSESGCSCGFQPAGSGLQQQRSLARRSSTATRFIPDSRHESTTPKKEPVSRTVSTVRGHLAFLAARPPS